MIKKIRRFLGIFRWKVVRLLVKDLERGFFYRQAGGGWEKLTRWVFSKLNTEKFNICLDDEILIRYDDNKTLLFAARKSVLERDMAYNGKFYLIDFASPLIKEHSVCLDIGANSGVFSVALGMRHPKSDFFCFEPHPKIFYRLKQNIAANRLTNVYPFEKAVSDNENPVTLFSQDLTSADNWGLSSIVYSPAIGVHNKIKVESITCDKFKEQYFPNKKVSFMKIDVQGAEFGVLKGASSIMRVDRPVIVFEHEDEFFEDKNLLKSQIKSLLHKHGYRTFVLSKRFNKMFFPVDWNSEISVDLLAVPIADFSDAIQILSETD